MKVLTPKLLDDLSSLAALGWTDAELAGFLDITERQLADILADPTSTDNPNIRDAIKRGQLEKRAKIELAVVRGAMDGDSGSIDQFRDIVRDKSFSISKLDLFGGAEKEGAFERIQEYIASGSKGDLSDKERVYIDLLTLVYSLDGQYGKRRTVRFLTSEPFGLPYQRAADIYSEAMELFYCNRKVSKEALRNKMADQFDTLYVAARNAAKTSKDYAVAADILANKARALQLDKDDPAKLPAEIYQPMFRLLSATPESIGLPAANRDELERQIETVVAPEAVKRRLRTDAGITDLDIVKYLEDAKEES
jgi:hypothetical protein|nr:MAG TPA: hypothetical protein [Caudoviricetes sp.]